jgi:hypothetical protein
MVATLVWSSQSIYILIFLIDSKRGIIGIFKIIIIFNLIKYA